MQNVSDIMIRKYGTDFNCEINVLERRIEVKNIDRIRSMNESELAELLHETPFDCANRCPDFDCGCLRTCTHGAGIDIIREWLETEIAT